MSANATRPGAPDVRPRELARFYLPLAGNGRAPSTYTETFGVVWEGWRWLAPTLTLTYRVA